ncbi:galactose-6-phosphate isomerase subunit LacA [Paenibacillus kribbensis]|uniref:galactose-6-phosphate isomerase subunit LacA n=1 Tax=Paenibacillus kribbensis TaxID=172713 RepID=UPI0008394026|nr:galactose-6-phosphate isomerase subunit LacA [Paenibacillus kribbensis]
MKFIIGSDRDGLQLKETLKAHLLAGGHEVADKTAGEATDCVEAARTVAEAVAAGEGDYGIAVDLYGVGSYMAANKVKGIVCAALTDEYSAHMTREHNNSSMIALGSGVIGEQLALRIVDAFTASAFDGGRQRIRVDMLKRMIREEV